MHSIIIEYQESAMHRSTLQNATLVIPKDSIKYDRQVRNRAHMTTHPPFSSSPFMCSETSVPSMFSQSSSPSASAVSIISIFSFSWTLAPLTSTPYFLANLQYDFHPGIEWLKTNSTLARPWTKISVSHFLQYIPPERICFRKQSPWMK